MRLIKLKILLFFYLIAVGSFAQKNPPKKFSIDKNPFGVAWGFEYGYSSKPAVFMPQLRDMGVNKTKIYVFWHQLEPQKGKYDWGAVDAFLDQLKEGDEALIAVFSSSAWATQTPSTLLPPSPAKSSDDYYEFIYQLVKHCQGKIKYWQNDCEPSNPVYWAGTDDEYINQLKVFSKAVKDADPAAQVVLGGHDGLFNPPGQREFPHQQKGLAFFEKIIQEASDSFDVFDLRLYADPYTIPYRVNYFREKLAASGSLKPIICTEYNGPGFFEFPENRKYFGLMGQWNQAIASSDTASYFDLKGQIQSMHDDVASLAPQTQLFVAKRSSEMDRKYNRLQGRDLVMRNMLALSSGVKETFYWDLWHNTEDPYDMMAVLYGKNKLMEYKEGQFSERLPLAEVFEQMAKTLKSPQSVKQLKMPGKENLFLFEVSCSGEDGLVYVAWEKRDVFSGEDEPAIKYTLPIVMKNAVAIDVFGNNAELKAGPKGLTIDLASTPVYIYSEERK